MRKRIKRIKDVRDKEERMRKEWNISFFLFGWKESRKREIIFLIDKNALKKRE